MEQIKHFMLPDHTNSLYENEAISSIALTKEVGDKINELVDAYNDLYGVDLKWKQEVEGKVHKGVIFMKDNLLNSLHELFELFEKDDTFNRIYGSKLSEAAEGVRNLTTHITPEMFGCVGDGITDDTIKLQRAIRRCEETGQSLIFHSGKTYHVKSITLTKHVDLNFNGCTLKSKIDDYVLKIDCANTPNKRHVIQNVNIEGVKGIYLRGNLTTLQDITMQCSKAGLVTSDCYELSLNNLKVIGEGQTIGYEFNCTDSSIRSCVATNVKTGFILNNSTNYVYDLHGWNNVPVRGSVLLMINSTRACILHDIYADSIENGIVAECPKVTVYNYIYSFLKSIGGENRVLNCITTTNTFNIFGGYVNYTGDNNFTFSNKFGFIENVEDRVGVCKFKFIGTEGNTLLIDYINGKQVIKYTHNNNISVNLNYLDTFNDLVNFPTKTYSGYASITRMINEVSYTINIPVIFRFEKDTNRTILYVYHDEYLETAILESVI